MEAYFDNCATTKVFDCVKDVVINSMIYDFGNPSSMHEKGVDAENYIKTAKSDIAKTLKVDGKEILFTSGGTESNNLAIIGTAMANRRAGMHLITSSIEHPSVLNTMKALEEEGFRVTYLPVDNFGVIKTDALREAICDDTILVSVMYVNNEVGSVQPIEKISKIISEKNEKALFHVDAVQAYGKYEIRPKKLGIDLMSVSAHKIHGPKGVGFLYVKDKAKIKPIIFGGGQQKGMRSGTENVPGIAGMGCAAKEIYSDFTARRDKMIMFKDYFIDRVQELPGVTVNSRKGEDGAPHIVSVSFEGVRSEVLLHALEAEKVYVSAGSACTSNKPAVSDTLKNMGIKKELLNSTIRFSFSSFTTREEIDYCMSLLSRMLEKLRIYTRR